MKLCGLAIGGSLTGHWMAIDRWNISVNSLKTSPQRATKMSALEI
jgi:hypothetical protein